MNRTLKGTTIFLAFTFLVGISSEIFGQEAKPNNSKRQSKVIQEVGGRPDIPGDLMIEFGFNWVQEHSPGIGWNTMGSRTFNAYYLYEANLGESAFSFHPGIGVGTEKYKFTDDLTLEYGLNDDGERELQYVPLDSIFGLGTSYVKSQVNPNYIDIPLEFRWRSRTYDPKRSVKIAIGGKVGFLFDSKTKVKYTDRIDGDKKISKQKESWQLNTIRYGAHMRLGYGAFSLWGYYGLSDLFKKDEGPQATTMYPITFGVSLALF